MGQRFESLQRLGRAAQTLATDPDGRKRLPEIRNHAIAALGLTDLRVHVQHDYGVATGLGFDAVVERYALVERSGDVVVRRIDDASELARLPGPQDVTFGSGSTQFSPDGELLVAGYPRGSEGILLRIWHVGTRELKGSLTSGPARTFHPDGRRLLFSPREGGIAIWDSRGAG